MFIFSLSFLTRKNWSSFVCLFSRDLFFFLWGIYQFKDFSGVRLMDCCFGCFCIAHLAIGTMSTA